MEKVYLSKLVKNIVNVSEDCIVTSVVVDSRLVEKGSVFLAIKGEKVNGENYAKGALDKGACFVFTENFIEDIPKNKQCVVDNILNTSITLGANFRDLYSIDIVGVTGSVGKTSTKDFIYAALSPFAKTVRSIGNKNNEIGMPQTIFTFTKDDKYAVLEMGMSRFSDIHKLSVAAKPKYAVITCIGVSHLETMQTQENILKAKLEIIDGMDSDGFLILNADDSFLSSINLKTPKNILYYGIENKNASVSAENITSCGFTTFFDIVDRQRGSFCCTIPAIGTHNVMNALAAYAVVTAMGYEGEKTAKNLSGFEASGMRQKIVTKNDVTFIEDCYNASPDSMHAAINTLSQINSKRKIAVLGDMLELGEKSIQLHKQVGEYAKNKNINILFTYGEKGKSIALGFGDGAKHFNSIECLAKSLKEIILPGDAVVFKASRGMAFEEIIKMTYQI